MSDISILPNPFKMLDLEREKRIKVTTAKCNKCDDKKKEGFNNLNKDNQITEGLKARNTTEYTSFFCVLSVISFVILGVGVTSEIPILIPQEFSTSKPMWHFVGFICYLGFASMALYIPGNADNIFMQFGIPFVVGLVVFCLRYFTGLIGYFENTVGHFMCWIWTWRHGGLNKWIRSDNFEALVMHNDEVTINFNPLMSLFNLENYEKNTKLMRIEGAGGDNSSNTTNTSDFFLSIKHEYGKEIITDFQKYIKSLVILKRMSGEVTLLVITALLSVGIFESIHH